MAVTASERYVTELLCQRFGVVLEKIPKSSDKSPDFAFHRDGQRVFTAELKDIEHRPASSERGWLMPQPGDEIQWASRDDNSVRRVASKIHEAWTQLRLYSGPYVLIFLNHDPLVDVGDLQEAFTGQQVYGNQNFSYVNTAWKKKIAEGRIKHEKDKIDLYIWIERREEKMWFRYPTHVGHDLAHTYFPSIAEP